MLDLVLLRHGQSTWNELNLFTGWEDVDLTPRGEEEAVAAGALILAQEDLDVRVVHTSLLTRAIRTAEICLHEAGRSWVPVRRHWRLNERHYGDLQGRNKKETAERHGAEQLKLWRRSYDTPPPPLPDGDERHAGTDPRYDGVPADALPTTECLADVVERVVPYWQDVVVPDLLGFGARGGSVLVVAHGNSIRAIRKHIEGISDTDIVDLEIPTGIPYRYLMREDLSILSGEYMGDPDAARRAAEAVARQAG
ncbi:MAG: 2,3-diphosphoglycerate-dependent phosphoglycerate mutase [Acidimicrobiales bacterium]|jgi:2,3-bisphosphoglycerate-dependent phosphoglycerate mutase